MIKIPSTKASPKDIPIFLELIKKNKGDVKKMQEGIHEYLLDKSKKISRDEENSFYAIAIPVLNRLELIQDKGDNFFPTQDGLSLIDAYQKEDDSYKEIFAKILLRIDNEKGFVIKTLESIDKSIVDLDELVLELKKNDVDTKEKDSRLLIWLRLLDYAKLINFEKNQIEFNKKQILGISKKLKLNLNEFENELYDSYEIVKKRNRGGAYVSIPELQEEMIKKLGNIGFTSFEFRKFFTKLLDKKPRKKILVSKPGVREEDGIKINNTYYYYVSIYDVK